MQEKVFKVKSIRPKIAGCATTSGYIFPLCKPACFLSAVTHNPLHSEGNIILTELLGKHRQITAHWQLPDAMMMDDTALRSSTACKWPPRIINTLPTTYRCTGCLRQRYNEIIFPVFRNNRNTKSNTAQSVRQREAKVYTLSNIVKYLI